MFKASLTVLHYLTEGRAALGEDMRKWPRERLPRFPEATRSVWGGGPWEKPQQGARSGFPGLLCLHGTGPS